MAQTVNYKQPRAVNPVSITIVALLAFAAYMGVQYFDRFLVRQEAYRLCEEVGSRMSGRMWEQDPKLAAETRKRLTNDLHLLGIEDPELEVWIDVERGKSAAIGAVWTETIHYPFDVVDPITRDARVEHVADLDRTHK